MSNMCDVPVITIDGPSGTGKGTLSYKLAKYLGWHFLDSGAIYRVLGIAAVKSGVSFDSVDDLVELALNLDLKFIAEDDFVIKIYLNNTDVTNDCRSEVAGQNASKISSIPHVREALLARQRAFALSPGLVTDGRDMGTVVFPNAQLKIYLDATPDERAKRRFLQLQGRGIDVSLKQVLDELTERDIRDMARLHAPLKAAPDAILVDTTGLTIVQVFASI